MHALFVINFLTLKMRDNPKSQESSVSQFPVSTSTPELVVLRKANLIFNKQVYLMQHYFQQFSLVVVFTSLIALRMILFKAYCKKVRNTALSVLKCSLFETAMSYRKNLSINKNNLKSAFQWIMLLCLSFSL